jgi:hypothetical protein
VCWIVTTAPVPQGLLKTPMQLLWVGARVFIALQLLLCPLVGGHEVPQYVGTAELELHGDTVVVKLAMAATFGTAVSVHFDETLVEVCGLLGSIPSFGTECERVLPYVRQPALAATGYWWFIVRQNTTAQRPSSLNVTLDFFVDHLQVLDDGMPSRVFDVMPNGFDLFSAPASPVLFFEYMQGGIGYLDSLLHAPGIDYGCQEMPAPLEGNAFGCYITNVVPEPTTPWLVLTRAYQPPPLVPSNGSTSGTANCSIVAIERQVRVSVVPQLRVNFLDPIFVWWALNSTLPGPPPGYVQGAVSVTVSGEDAIGVQCRVLVPQAGINVSCGAFADATDAAVRVQAAHSALDKYADFAQSPDGLFVLGSAAADMTSPWHLLITVANATGLESAYLHLSRFSPLSDVPFDSPHLLQSAEPVVFHLRNVTHYAGAWAPGPFPIAWAAGPDTSALDFAFRPDGPFTLFPCDGSDLYLMPLAPLPPLPTSFSITLPPVAEVALGSTVNVSVAAFGAMQLVMDNPSGKAHIVAFSSDYNVYPCSVYTDYEWDQPLLPIFASDWAPLPPGKSFLFLDFTSDPDGGAVMVRSKPRLERVWLEGGTLNFTLVAGEEVAIAIEGVPFGLATYHWLDSVFPAAWQVYWVLRSYHVDGMGLDRTLPNVVWANDSTKCVLLVCSLTLLYSLSLPCSKSWLQVCGEHHL